MVTHLLDSAHQVPKQISDSLSEKLQLGILDTGLIVPGKTASDVIKETLLFASTAESLGYSRYWLTEHHESFFAWASPEIILPLIAQRTNKIRVGTAGILLYFYKSLKIAEIFRLLEVLYPKRIDLGVAAGIAADKTAMQALYESLDRQEVIKNNLYGDKVEELIAYLTNNFPQGHRFEKGATPTIDEIPEVWLLGTGTGNMRLAAAQGTAFGYSIFHGPSKCDPTVLQQYRDKFKPSKILAKPHCNLTLSVICAETESQAKKQQILFEKVDKTSRINVVGNPNQCQEQILEIQEKYQVDEIILFSLWHIFEKRKLSYEMLAEVLDLPKAAIG